VLKRNQAGRAHWEWTSDKESDPTTDDAKKIASAIIRPKPIRAMNVDRQCQAK